MNLSRLSTLADNDRVTMNGWYGGDAEQDCFRGFGECALGPACEERYMTAVLGAVERPNRIE